VSLSTLRLDYQLETNCHSLLPFLIARAQFVEAESVRLLSILQNGAKGMNHSSGRARNNDHNATPRTIRPLAPDTPPKLYSDFEMYCVLELPGVIRSLHV
jgi:hypothetical protein